MPCFHLLCGHAYLAALIAEVGILYATPILIGLVIQRIRLTHLDQRLLGVVSLVLLLRIRSMGLWAT